MSALVTYQSADGVATVTIDRAERMNALDEGVVQGLNA
ncbi:MAG: enoyl-CoA hydratase, partial [Gammaproteobacteria bacterium]|nr:enoyl-CoA hydratase [Gammaproteobacteria bacterium]